MDIVAIFALASLREVADQTEESRKAFFELVAYVDQLERDRDDYKRAHAALAAFSLEQSDRLRQLEKDHFDLLWLNREYIAEINRLRDTYEPDR